MTKWQLSKTKEQGWGKWRRSKSEQMRGNRRRGMEKSAQEGRGNRKRTQEKGNDFLMMRKFRNKNCRWVITCENISCFLID